MGTNFCFLNKGADDGWDEWEEVFSVVENYTIPNNLITGTLLETYGGGPSGGYLIQWNKKQKINNVWSWNQNWGTEKRFSPYLQLKKEDIEYRKIDDAPPGGPWDYIEMRFKKQQYLSPSPSP